MTDHRTRLAQAAQAAWADAAPRLGLSPDPAALTVISARREPRGGRIVARIMPGQGRPNMILKLRLGGDPERLAQATRAYHRAALSLAAHPGRAVPRVIMALPDHHAVILSECPGTDARSFLADSTTPADHPRVMQAAGQWLGALHRGQSDTPAVFDPANALRALTRRARNTKSPHHPALIRLVEQSQTLAAALSGRLWPRAVIHGDMTLGNLLIAPGQISGIDLENDSPAPIARDIAMLLIDHELWFGHHPAAISSFWQGYGADLGDDPLLRFHITLRLARLWSDMPPDPAKITPRRAHLWSGLQA
ncbi:MAG: aminoglycoside phosphotransferase family protein, partial [Rhodobacterales bacterium]|nr:aminoglycoside phosphotransferase family protein [Rhodobacterales bacterium]MDX5413828.1 aminoglycoside phosphotransferase family protein [Rhodobacterales bacterium]